MLLYFNPGHETAVLNASPYYVPSDTVLKMQHDLAFLPAWYGAVHDLVWVERDFPMAYFNTMQTLFPAIPKVVCKNNLSLCAQQELACWGITPQAFHYFETLKKQSNIQLIIPEWREEFVVLTSRQPAKECLEELLLTIPDISPQLLPQHCNSVKEVEQIVLHTNSPLLVKAPYSSSGRGLLWLRNGLGSKEREVLHGILKKQLWVTVEPVVQKMQDFSMQFTSDGKGNVCFEGYSIFNTNDKGSYQESLLQRQSKMEQTIISFISSALLEQTKQQVFRFLQKKYALLYKGAISVDMMIYQDEGGYRLHPCVEINMRYNMGFLALQLFENYIYQDSSGIFKLHYYRDTKTFNFEHYRLAQQYPLQIKAGKIKAGYLSLCPVEPETHYCAYVMVGGNVNKCREKLGC